MGGEDDDKMCLRLFDDYIRLMSMLTGCLHFYGEAREINACRRVCMRCIVGAALLTSQASPRQEVVPLLLRVDHLLWSGRLAVTAAMRMRPQRQGYRLHRSAPLWHAIGILA